MGMIYLGLLDTPEQRLRRLRRGQMLLNVIGSRRCGLKLAAMELGISAALISAWRRGTEVPSRAQLTALRRLAKWALRID